MLGYPIEALKTTINSCMCSLINRAITGIGMDVTFMNFTSLVVATVITIVSIAESGRSGLIIFNLYFLPLSFEYIINSKFRGMGDPWIIATENFVYVISRIYLYMLLSNISENDSVACIIWPVLYAYRLIYYFGYAFSFVLGIIAAISVTDTIFLGGALRNQYFQIKFFLYTIIKLWEEALTPPKRLSHDQLNSIFPPILGKSFPGDCIICTEALNVHKFHRRLKCCDLLLHAHCIDVWLSKSDMCPNCRCRYA